MALINVRNRKYHKDGMDDTANSVKTCVDSGNLNFAGSSGIKRSYLQLFTMSRPRTFALSTFFFEALTRRGCYDYEGVRKWLIRRGEDISRLDLLLIPINFNQLHWVLAAIDIRNCHLLYFDSMLAPDSSQTLGTLKKWLNDEVNDKAGKAFAYRMEVSGWRTTVNPAYTPCQIDSHSCGLFKIYMADYLARGARPDFNDEHIETLRLRTILFLKRAELPN